MPFQSEKQRRYMHANLPDIAKRWERDYSNGGVAELNAELNSLPEYYLPKNQGGRIGYAHGVHGNQPIKIWGKSVKEQWPILNQNQKDYIKDHFPDQVPTEGNAQGGLIPSHEAGIYGLAEGGQLVKPGPGRPGYGGPHETEQAGRDYADTSPSDVGSGGGAQYRGGETYMAPVDVTSTYTTTAPTTDDETAREKYISEQYKGPKRDIYAGTDLEEQREIDKRIAQRKLDYGLNLTKQEKKNLEVGLGLRDVKPKRSIWKTIGMGAAIITGVAPLLGFQAPAAVQTVAQFNALHNKASYALDKFNQFNNTNYTLEGLFNKVNDDKIKTYATEEKLRAETKKLQEALPKNHPESIALETQTKTKTPSKMDEDGVNIKYTSEEITDTNDAKADIARLEQKYLEMNQASRLAWERQQQMNRDKQMAYYQMFRKRYMAAGGRVPAGYNTGGLSNLFRLKNV